MDEKKKENVLHMWQILKFITRHQMQHQKQFFCSTKSSKK